MAESHREEIAKLEALYAGNPGGRVFVHLAEAYRKAGEHERARRILEEGLARHTDSASGYVVLGRVLADMQITGEAEAAFRRVLELDGGNLVALRWLGDLARQAGRNGEAAAHYRELLVRNPSNEEVRDLVEIVERADPAARAADEEPAGVEPLTDWAAPSEDAADVSGELAVAEPVSAFEERAVTPPRVEEPVPADITPWSAAPGQTEDVTEPEVEYGMVDIEALPGDALHVEPHGEAASPGADAKDAESVGSAAPGGLVETGQAEDSDLVVTWDDTSGDELELEELSRDDEAEPMEIHLLDPSYEPADDQTEDLDVALDLMDLSSLAPDEDEGEYADADFVADLSSMPQEEMAGADFAPVGADSPFILLPEEPAPADAGTAAAPPLEPEGPEVIEQGAYDVVAEESLEVTAEEPSGIDSSAAAWEAPAEVPAEAEPEQGLVELAGAAEPAAESQDGFTPHAVAASPGALTAEPAAAAETGLVTETMALLYRTQGFHDRAADVYRALLRQRPGDERLAARLREAEEAAGAKAVAPPDDDAGEVWLRGVGAAWTGAPDQPDDATPYTWTSDTDEVAAGEPISDYLRELVAWKAGQGRWSETAQESSAPARGTDTDATPPDWLMPAAGDDTAMPWADAAVEEVASWSPAQVPAEDARPWTPPAEPEPETPAPGMEPRRYGDELPADPWLQGVPESPEASAAPAAESAAGWTPLELDRDIPERSHAAPVDMPPSPPVSAAPDDDEAEDEDLEMFRSWLQSLKK